MGGQGQDAVPLLLFAGGGTGGHLFPLLAVADAARAAAEVAVVFVGTARGIESRVLPARGERLELLDLSPIQGGGPKRAFRGVAKAALALPRAHALLKRLRPSAVLSVGGYASGPIGLAAWARRTPVAILEPNSILGLANRWLRPFARRAYVAFPETERQLGAKARLTGVPLRAGFEPQPYEPRSDRFHVLVLGGSQGAAILNERLPEALRLAKIQVPALTVTHQAGRDRDAQVYERYRGLASAEGSNWPNGQAVGTGGDGAGGWIHVVPFIDDVARSLADADLIIQRSGASAVAELCAVGRPAILVPFARAADDHQRKNAQALESAGAAICVVEAEATVERIAREVVNLARDPERRARMARAAAERANVSAARVVAHDLLELAGIPLHSTFNHSAVVPGVPRV